MAFRVIIIDRPFMEGPPTPLHERILDWLVTKKISIKKRERGLVIDTLDRYSSNKEINKRKNLTADHFSRFHSSGPRTSTRARVRESWAVKLHGKTAYLYTVIFKILQSQLLVSHTRPKSNHACRKYSSCFHVMS
jgi:hypothetical protein